MNQPDLRRALARRLARQRHRAAAGHRRPALTIRKFKKDKLKLDQLVKFGSISPAGAKILQIIGACRCNVLISGGTGSGKTTLLNC
jgi:Flp pilus assembly CpaF family ATPase